MSEVTPIDEIPVSVMLEQLVYPSRKVMVNERFRIEHLASERGRTLNGKICVVRGFDASTTEARLHCSVEGMDKMMKLKVSNLVPVEAKVLQYYMANSSPIPDEKLAACLEIALEKHTTQTDRPDLLHRLGLYRGLMNKIRAHTTGGGGPPLSDTDYCMPCGAGSELLGGDDDPYAVVMHNMKPACYGNMSADMRHMDIGLKGDGHTECSVCCQVLAEPTSILEETMALVTLPCLHVFHEACIMDWLESDLGQLNWNCPSCRAPVADEMSTYRVNYDQQLQRRFIEYPLSGFCTKCMIWIMERERNQVLGYIDQEGGLPLS